MMSSRRRMDRGWRSGDPAVGSPSRPAGSRGAHCLSITQSYQEVHDERAHNVNVSPPCCATRVPHCCSSAREVDSPATQGSVRVAYAARTYDIRDSGA